MITCRPKVRSSAMHLGDDVFIRIDEVQPADQRVEGDVGKDVPGMATDVDHPGMGAAREDRDPFPPHVGGHEALVHDPQMRFPTAHPPRTVKWVWKPHSKLRAGISPLR